MIDMSFLTQKVILDNPKKTADEKSRGLGTQRESCQKQDGVFPTIWD